MNFRLPKNERLHSKKLIKELFDKGSSFFLYPFKVLVLDAPPGVDETHQVLFSVSKRKVKKAVSRNLIKRRVKEAYRLNKTEILAPGLPKKLIGLIYVSSELATFQVIEKKIIKMLQMIAKDGNSTNNNT
jgi:ribonuclease P protein component